MTERLLKISEVEQITSMSEAQIRRRVKAGTFPNFLHISPKRVVWIGSEIDAWVQNTIQTARSST